MKQEVIEALPAAGMKVGWTGALLSTAGALTLTEWLAVGGFLVAVIGSIGGLALNAYFKHRRDRREQMLADLQIDLLRSGQASLQSAGEDD